MCKKATTGIMLTLLLIGMVTSAFNLGMVGVDGAASTCSSSASVEPPATEWNKTYGGAHNDQAWSVEQTSDGGYIIAGDTSSFGAGGRDFWLVKTDGSGNPQWNKTYGEAGEDTAWSVQQTGDGGFIVAGKTDSFGTGGLDFWLVKTDACGNMEWNKTYGGVHIDQAWSVKQTSDGGYIVAGGTNSFGASVPGYPDFWLIKLAPSFPVRNLDTHLGYMTIQEAIDAPETLNGHTILVDAGIYYEHVTISKSLKLIGENKDATIIDGNGTGVVVRVTADNTTISGFTMQNSGTWPNSGINLYHSQNNSVYENNAINNYYGIRLEHSSKCSIFGNNITDNGEAGIRIDSSNNNLISCNTMANNDFGISQWPSFNNTIDGNIIRNTGTGIWLYSSSNNSITRNAFVANNWGMNLHKSSHNTISGNNLTYNIDQAILLPAAYNNTVTYNNIANNGRGLVIRREEIEYGGAPSTYNAVIGNNITNNSAGIVMDYAFNNTIYHNNIINNTEQTRVSNSSSNAWDNGYPSGGNYWNDYGGVDLYSGPYQNETDSDGIGDTPYVIDDDNIDHYPLMKPYPWGPHDIGVTCISKSKTVIGQGFIMHVNVTIFNYGAYAETFNITAHANTIIIDTLTNITLSSGDSTTLTFTWNTTGVAKGNYTITAEATQLPGETDTLDNTRTDGWIIVAMIGDITGGTPNVMDFIPDGKVDMKDIGVIARYFGQNVPPAPSNCDITGPTIGVPDDKIDMRDIGTVARNFGKTDP